MKMRQLRRWLPLLVLLGVAALATACDGTNAPQLIAAYPQRDEAAHSWTVAPARPQRQVCDQTYPDCDWRRDRERSWDPAETFRAAFGVFLKLFQLLVDALIWIAVVAGPFVLMGVGAVVILRRVREGRESVS